MKSSMTNVSGNVDIQIWTDAFEKRSDGFEAALAPEVVLNASALIKPIVDRDLVKVCMQAASNMYERLTFFAQAKSEGRTWLEWKARTFSGLELADVTVPEINAAVRLPRSAFTTGRSRGSPNSRPNSAEGSKARSTAVTSTGCPNKLEKGVCKNESYSIRAVWRACVDPLLHVRPRGRQCAGQGGPC